MFKRKLFFILLLVLISAGCSKQPEVCDISHRPSNFKEITTDDLSKEQLKLLNKASEVMMNSYSPYSKFRVGAAILTKDKKIFTGTNVEDATSRTGTCAERAAIFNAVANGATKSIVKIALTGAGHDFDTEEVVAPCGVCRQALYEFSQLSGVDIEIIMSNTKKTKIIVARISELLPLAFGPKDVGMEI